jgi:SAM-dependent methyltransferase
MTEKTIDYTWELTNDFWVRIAEITNQHGYMSGVDRQSNRVKATGEVFTPTELVINILQKLPIEELRSGKKVLDPACGDGQFLLPAILVKLALKQISEPSILETDESRIQAKLEALGEVFGVDIMKDNVLLARHRILRVLGLTDHEQAQQLVRNNILIGNTLNPNEDIDGQTSNDKKQMIALFTESNQGALDQEHQQKKPLEKHVFLHRINQPTQAVFLEFLAYLKATGQKIPKNPKRIGLHTEIYEYVGQPFRVSQDF